MNYDLAQMPSLYFVLQEIGLPERPKVEKVVGQSQAKEAMTMNKHKFLNL